MVQISSVQVCLFSSALLSDSASVSFSFWGQCPSPMFSKGSPKQITAEVQTSQACQVSQKVGGFLITDETPKNKFHDSHEKLRCPKSHGSHDSHGTFRDNFLVPLSCGTPESLHTSSHVFTRLHSFT